MSVNVFNKKKLLSINRKKMNMSARNCSKNKKKPKKLKHINIHFLLVLIKLRKKNKKSSQTCGLLTKPINVLKMQKQS